MVRTLVFTLAFASTLAVARDGDNENAPTRFNEATIAQLQAEMNSGQLTSVGLVQFYLERIEALDPGVNAILELNPDALKLAAQADQMRGHVSLKDKPLLGIPILLKDNIDTGDKMQTTAGSFVLFGQPALQDSTLVGNLRAKGAIILGKTNLSEWANFRSTFSTSGWSGRGGLTHNPYSLDRNACGSSSGSGAAASANFATISLGSETDGSIVCPANVNGVVGFKPTIGLVSRGGVVPISHNQDTVGPHARTVADAVATLNAIVSRSPDPRDAYTGGVPLGWEACDGSGGGPYVCTPSRPIQDGKHNRPALPADYSAFLNSNGLSGARLGLTRSGITNSTPQVQSAFYAAIAKMGAAGATIIDLDDPNSSGNCSGITGAFCQPASPPFAGFSPAEGEFFVLEFDIRNDLANYFATRKGVPAAGGTLQTAIDFNNAHADVEMPYFGQEIFLQAEGLKTGANDCQPDFSSSNFPDAACPAVPGGGTQITYNDGLVIDHKAGASLDAALQKYNLDAILAPTDSPAWTTDLILTDHFTFASSGLAGPPGYPIIQVPSGDVFGMPVGVSFIGTAFSEPTLIRLASGFEAASHARFQPTFTPDVTTPHTLGTFLAHPPDLDTKPRKQHHHF
ncbi:MAG: amidase [Acidobacteria bacterium]|nr:amidase [Acidobacteriota bacterium]MBV9147397.1 amidase [Acidobacteriota bacterium]MBV9435448.1 amidase [Acidobacteriota bacterium]